jgi:serine/threonine protein kinase/tetratricopeptide (TPR) repeat protein
VVVEALRERFGKYHVLEKIAQGGMAEVYKVKTIGIAGFEKIQALKRILPHQAREPRFIRSFVDEARIAAELTHRNIVQVFDFGKADGELFMAMELIEGRDLRTAMAQATARDLLVPIPVAAYIVSEVAAGLDYAHRKTDGYGTPLGIVHCDVSPSNVMLSGEGYVKILDFGIARASFASALERRRLRGKPRYMAPEQTIGEPATAAADVFALGILAWELFTGLPLYRGHDLKSILEAVRRTNPPRIDKLNPHVPSEIVDAVAIALSREPVQRGTAGDLVQALARTAMGAGARALAAWLADLDARPSALEMSWAQDPISRSLAMKPGVPPDPPLRPSTRSLTVSINAPVLTPPTDVSVGTPPPLAFPMDAPSDRTTDPRAPKLPPEGATPATGQPFSVRMITETAPVRFEITGQRWTDRTSSGSGQRWSDRTSSGSGQRWTERTPSSSGQRFIDPTAAQWAPQGTAAGVGRLADALPPEVRPEPFGHLPEPIVRQSYEKIEPSPGRFDDDATSQSPAAPEATSFDDLQVELEFVTPADAAPIDEPIDDDLTTIATAAVADRRRTVVVAGLLEGAERDQLRPVAKSLGELAYQRGGVVLELADDALIVVFGLEVVGEDDVAIAMGWALDAAAMAKDAGGVEADGIRLRVGARTGVATSKSENLVPAEAIDEARTLAREAAPERPLFVGAAGRTTSGLYQLRELPAPRAIARPSRVIELVGPRGFDERDRARLERRGNFVGRTAQLAELETWLSRAVAANRRLTVLVTGATGTGKSRLIAELIARKQAAGTELRVVTTAGNPASRTAPFALIIELYQAALGLPPARGRNARAQLVQRLLHVLSAAGMSDERARLIATDLDRAMELRDGVSLDTPDIADLRPRISAGLTAFRHSLVERDRPLVTVIEDIHFADGASLEVLRHILAVTADGPELLVLTTRPDGPPPPAVDATLTVGDLVGTDLRALIVDRLGDAATPQHIAAVVARGGGNPLFIEELAQAVREAGGDVPASAREVVAARVERLTPRAKTALRLAAVMGAGVRTHLLDELVAEDSVKPTTGELSALDAELDELVQAGFLARRDDGELAFTRGLMREVIYDQLTASEQRETHARIGRMMASRFFAGREEPPAQIAEHMELGGETAAAAAFWLRAGRLALAASDGEAAVQHFSRVLELEQELGTAPPTPASRTRRREALAGRETAHRLAGDLASNPGDLDDLEALCAGDERRLADVAIRRAHRLLRIGDFAGASNATILAEDLAIAARDMRARGEALRIRGEVLERLGRFDEAQLVVEDARALFAREGAVSEEMAAMVGRGRIHLMRAQYEAARDAYRPVIARIEKASEPWLERIVHNHVAIIEMCLGNYTAAMASAQRSLLLCRRYGDRPREGDALSVAGTILLEVGLFDQASATFAEALELLTKTGSRWSRADCLIYAGACEARRGSAHGLAMLEEAIAESNRLGARYLEANALITRAGVYLRAGLASAAEADAAAGTAIARGTTLVGYEIQGLARTALAIVRDPAGNRIADAGAMVHRALELLDEQRFVEGSEEDVYAACVEVLIAGRADDRAAQVKARGAAEVTRKLAGLDDLAWRVAYAGLPECRALLE